MRRHVGRTLVLILLGLLAAAAAILRTPWAGEKVCQYARAKLPGAIGMDVAIASCRVEPLSGGVELSGFALTPRGQAEPAFAAERLLVQIRALELAAGRIALERVEVQRPRVRADLTKLELGGGGASQGCFLDELRRFELGSLAVDGASVRVLAPGGRTVELEDVDLDLRLSRRAYAVRLGVPRGTVETGRVRLPLSRLRFSSTLDLDRKKLTINHLEVKLGELALFTRGDVESLCEPSLGLEASLYLPLDLVSTMLGPSAPKMSGTAVVNLKRAEGSLTDPTAELEVTLSRAKVEAFEVGDAYLEARVDKGQLKVRKLELEIGDGRARVSGTVGLGKGFPVSAAVDLEEVPFGKLLDKLTLKHAWVDYRAGGHVELEGTLAPFHLAGPGAVDVRDFHVYSSGWDRPAPFHVLDLEAARVEVLTDFNLERVRLSRGAVRTPRGSFVEAEAALHFDPGKGFIIEAEPREVDLADLQHLIGIPWDGKLAGRALIKVIHGVPTIDATASIRDFRFHLLSLGTTEAQVRLRGSVLGFPAVTVHKGKSRVDAEGEFDLGGDEPRVRATGGFEGARLSDLVDAIGGVHWVFDPLRGHAEAKVSGTGSVEGPVLRTRATVSTRLQDFTYLDRKFGDGQLVFKAEDGQRILLDPIELEGPSGKLRLAGRVEFDQDLEFLLDAPVLYAEELAKPNGEFLGMRGTLDAHLRFFGPLDHPRAEGRVVARELGAFGVGLGSGTWAVTMDRTTLALKGPLGADLQLDGRLVFEGDLPFAVGVSASTAELGRYFPSVQGLKGSLAGELLATGTLVRYEETRGDVWVPQLSVGKGDWSFVNDGPLALSFQGGLVEIKSAAIKGTAGTQLTAAGVLDGDLDVSVDGSFDARALELFMPWLDQTAGKFQVSATIGGPPGRPEVVGNAQLENGRFTWKGMPVSGRDLKGSFEFSQNKLFLKEVEGTLNNGRLRASGDLELKDLVPYRYDLSALLDEAQFRYPETVPTTFSGELKLYGTSSALVLAGDLDLVRMRYSEEIDLDTFLSNARRRRVEARSFEKKEEWLRYDVKVHVLGGGGSRIDNNLLKVSLKGDLTVVGTNAHMGLLGTLLAEEDGRGYFRGNEFWLSRGAVDFTERDRIAASVDVHAESQVRDYKVWLHAYGPVEEPQVELQSEPELDRADVVALLTLGVTSRDRGTYSGAAGAGLVSETLLNIAGLDKQFKKFVPKNAIIRDFNFHISTQYSDVSGMVEPTAQLESKFLTDSLKLRLSQPVISGKGRRAQAEYRFNEHMSAQAQWDNESSDSSLGDLGLDLKLRWELD